MVVLKMDNGTKVADSKVFALMKGPLVRFVTDILFSILSFLLVFYVSLVLSLIGKSSDSDLVILLRLVVLLLISSATICSVIFALQSAFDFVESIRITYNENPKT